MRQIKKAAIHALVLMCRIAIFLRQKAPPAWQLSLTINLLRQVDLDQNVQSLGESTFNLGIGRV
jgi:hypothetical protein